VKKNKSTLIFKNRILPPHTNKKIFSKNLIKLSKFLKEISVNIDGKKDAFNVFSKEYKLGFKKENIKKYDHFKTVVIIGMGGSILGAKAIYSFLKYKIKKKFIFFDNLDDMKIKSFMKKKSYKNILFVIISKSGNTIETLVNLNLMKKIKLSKFNSIVITENSDNALRNFADKHTIPIIFHKNYIGGRYSVLSEVGMLPALLMNLNIKLFQKNLLAHFKNSVVKKSVSKIAQIFMSRKTSSLILFNYCPELNDFAFWYQQLIGESLGKKNKGLMPIVSVAPKDHHSLLQMYLDGPKDKFFYIISSREKKSSNMKKVMFKKDFNFLNNKKLNKIILSQKKAFIKVLSNKNIPFRELEISKFDEETIGELFFVSILETVLIGKLMKINPFNQPAVEEVKSLTKKYLN
jgi:glucose-6-phosphate isomerase